MLGWSREVPKLLLQSWEDMLQNEGGAKLVSKESCFIPVQGMTAPLFINWLVQFTPSLQKLGGKGLKNVKWVFEYLIRGEQVINDIYLFKQRFHNDAWFVIQQVEKNPLEINEAHVFPTNFNDLYTFIVLILPQKESKPHPLWPLIQNPCSNLLLSEWSLSKRSALLQSLMPVLGPSIITPMKAYLMQSFPFV